MNRRDFYHTCIDSLSKLMNQYKHMTVSSLLYTCFCCFQGLTILHRIWRSLYCALLLMLPVGLLHAETLYVYLPSNIKAKTVQIEFNKSCPFFDTSVFSRSKEFWSSYKQTTPSAILTSSPVYEHVRGFDLAIQGAFSGDFEENYYLVSVGDQTIDLQQLDSKRFGVLDVLGRRLSKKYFETVLNQKVKIKGVSKPRDLLPLLNFNMVDSLLVGERFVEYLKSNSTQLFSVFQLPAKRKLNLGAVKSGSSQDVQTALATCLENMNIPKYQQAYFGVDQWRKL